MASFFNHLKKAARKIDGFLTAGYKAEQEVVRIHLGKPPAKDEDEKTAALRRALTEEPLTTQFRRFASRVSRAIHYEPIESSDLNIIKLPATPMGQFFAKRNAHSHWNVWLRTGSAQGPEPLKDDLLGMDLPIGDALNLLAAQSRTAMQKQTHMHWHPVYVAKRAGHVFPDDLGHIIPVPRDLLPDPAKKNPPQPPRR